MTIANVCVDQGIFQTNDGEERDATKEYEFPLVDVNDDSIKRLTRCMVSNGSVCVWGGACSHMIASLITINLFSHLLTSMKLAHELAHELAGFFLFFLFLSSISLTDKL